MKTSFELHIVERLALAALLITLGMLTMAASIVVIKHHGDGSLTTETQAIAFFGVWFLTAWGLFYSPAAHYLSPSQPEPEGIDDV